LKDEVAQLSLVAVKLVYTGLQGLDLIFGRLKYAVATLGVALEQRGQFSLFPEQRVLDVLGLFELKLELAVGLVALAVHPFELDLQLSFAVHLILQQFLLLFNAPQLTRWSIVAR
jgi:hypothetical protein